MTFGASVGIGTGAPQTQLHITSTTAPDSQVTAQSLTIETSGYGDNNLQFARYSDTPWSKTRLWLLHARGTKASPAVLEDGDWLGTFGFGGWTPAGWADGVNINATVDGTPSGSVVPGKLVLSTVDGGGTSHDLTMLGNGNVGIGTDTPGVRLAVQDTSTDRVRLSVTNANSQTGPGATSRSAEVIFYGYDPGGTTLRPTFEVGTDAEQQGVQSWFVYDTVARGYRLYLGPSGSFGIGTITPAHPLDVAGDISTSGGLVASGRKVADGNGCYYS